MNESLPIRYAGWHDGQVRTLTVTLWGSRWWSGPTVHVNIDGFNHVLPWGTAVFEIPAGRAVTVSAYQVVNAPVGLASITLAPHDPPVLEYRSPGNALRAAELGPPANTRPRGSLSPATERVTAVRIFTVLLMAPAVIVLVLLLVAALL